MEYSLMMCKMGGGGGERVVNIKAGKFQFFMGNLSEFFSLLDKFATLV